MQIKSWIVLVGPREVRRLAAHDGFAKSLLTLTFADEELDSLEAEPPEVEQEFL